MVRFSRLITALLTAASIFLVSPRGLAADDDSKPDDDPKPAVADPAAYTIEVSGTDFKMEMVPIPGGVTRIGSPEGEPGRKPDEGATFEVTIEPFWMGRYEVTWDQYDLFRREYAARIDDRLDKKSVAADTWADAVSIPTPLWEQDSAPILAGLGQKGSYPVADISRFAARQFAKWLSRKTGQFYRLPTEAEWEHAARAGTRTAYFFGDDAKALGDYAWTFDNSEYEDPDRGYPGVGAGYRKVGQKKPNPWGLHDIYGNVSEWVLDGYDEAGYGGRGGKKLSAVEAIRWPTTIFPGVVRGGNWESDPEACRSASRLASSRKWQRRDPQIPKSLWWYTDAFHVGFRLVRPVKIPGEAEQRRHWDPEIPELQRILDEGAKQMRVRIDRAADATNAEGK